MRWFLCENLGSEELQPEEGPSRTSWGLERPQFWPPIVLEVVTTSALCLRLSPRPAIQTPILTIFTVSI